MCCYLSRDGGRFVGEGGNFVLFVSETKICQSQGFDINFDLWLKNIKVEGMTSRGTGGRLGHGSTECPWFYWFIFYIER